MTAICHVERAIALGAVYLLLPYRWAVVVIPLLPDRGRRKNHWFTEMSASFKGGHN
jgi:hypothetical protein